MEHKEYIEFCRQQIAASYQAICNGRPDNALKHRAEGLIHAARLLNILSAEAIAAMIEDEHMKVFGESVAERKSRRKALDELKTTSPEEYYEIPAISRR